MPRQIKNFGLSPIVAVASSRSLLGQDAPVTFQRTLKFKVDKPLGQFQANAATMHQQIIATATAIPSWV